MKQSIACARKDFHTKPRSPAFRCRERVEAEAEGKIESSICLRKADAALAGSRPAI